MTKITEIFLRNFLLFTYYRKIQPPRYKPKKSTPTIHWTRRRRFGKSLGDFFSFHFQWTRDCRLAHKSEIFFLCLLGKCTPADVASAPYTTKWKREVRFGKNPGNFLKNFSLHSLPRNSTPLPISENPAGIEPPLWEFSFLSF